MLNSVYSRTSDKLLPGTSAFIDYSYGAWDSKDYSEDKIILLTFVF